MPRTGGSTATGRTRGAREEQRLPPHPRDDDPAARHGQLDRCRPERRPPRRLDHDHPHRPVPPPARLPLAPARPVRPRPGVGQHEDQRLLPVRRRGARDPDGAAASPGIPIDHVIVVDFNSFKDLINAEGGITVNVPEPILSNRFDCPYSDRGALPASGRAGVFHRGPQHMDGERALIYSRIRENQLNPAENDLTRGARQQAVAQAATAKLTSFSTLLDLPFDGSSLMSPLATDLSAWQLIELGWVKFRASSSQALYCRLGGDATTSAGASVILPSEDNTKVLAMWAGLSAPQPPTSHVRAGLPDRSPAPVAQSARARCRAEPELPSSPSSTGAGPERRLLSRTRPRRPTEPPESPEEPTARVRRAASPSPCARRGRSRSSRSRSPCSGPRPDRARARAARRRRPRTPAGPARSCRGTPRKVPVRALVLVERHGRATVAARLLGLGSSLPRLLGAASPYSCPSRSTISRKQGASSNAASPVTALGRSGARRSRRTVAIVPAAPTRPPSANERSGPAAERPAPRERPPPPWARPCDHPTHAPRLARRPDPRRRRRARRAARLRRRPCGDDARRRGRAGGERRRLGGVARRRGGVRRQARRGRRRRAGRARAREPRRRACGPGRGAKRRRRLDRRRRRALDGLRPRLGDRARARASSSPAWFRCDRLHVSGYALLREPTALGGAAGGRARTCVGRRASRSTSRRGR